MVPVIIDYKGIGIGSGPKCDGLTPDPYLAGKAGVIPLVPLNMYSNKYHAVVYDAKTITVS
jgi:hypothetical protein